MKPTLGDPVGHTTDDCSKVRITCAHSRISCNLSKKENMKRWLEADRVFNTLGLIINLAKEGIHKRGERLEHQNSTSFPLKNFQLEYRDVKKNREGDWLSFPSKWMTIAKREKKWNIRKKARDVQFHPSFPIRWIVLFLTDDADRPDSRIQTHRGQSEEIFVLFPVSRTSFLSSIYSWRVVDRLVDFERSAFLAIRF